MLSGVNETLADLLADAQTLHAQNPKEADEPFRRALEQAKGEPALTSQVVRALWQVGRLEEVATFLEEVTGDASAHGANVERKQDPVLLTRLGAAHIRLGRLQRAVNKLYDALELSDNGYTALQLGNALRYLGEYEEAAGHLTRAFHKAKTERDGALAIAALCAQGELALDEGEAQVAIELFGKALGLTELSSHEPLSIAPLAGLSQAHTAWDYPKKAIEVGEKALRRAEAADDAVGKARALLSLGLAKQEVKLLERSEQGARNAPHRPLELRSKVARLELVSDQKEIEAVIREAQAVGMQREVKRLRAIL